MEAAVERTEEQDDGEGGDVEHCLSGALPPLPPNRSATEIT